MDLHFRDFGQPKNGTLLFCASANIGCDLWNLTIPFFVENGYRCVSYDRRGHGRSAIPGGGYDLDTLVDDIVALCDGLELRELAVIGHSLGGAEAIRFAARDQRVKRLLSIAATAPLIGREPLQPTLEAWRHDFPQWVLDNADAFFARPVSAGMMRWLTGLMIPHSPLVAAAMGETIASLDLRQDLASLAVPSLFLHGDLDASVPLKLGRSAAALARGSRFKVYPGRAHGVFLTDPREVHRDIFEFLRS
jgi:non-heme chloroperoxidase